MNTTVQNMRFVTKPAPAPAAKNERLVHWLFYIPCTIEHAKKQALQHMSAKAFHTVLGKFMATGALEQYTELTEYVVTRMLQEEEEFDLLNDWLDLTTEQRQALLQPKDPEEPDLLDLTPEQLDTWLSMSEEEHKDFFEGITYYEPEQRKRALEVHLDAHAEQEHQKQLIEAAFTPEQIHIWLGMSDKERNMFYEEVWNYPDLDIHTALALCFNMRKLAFIEHPTQIRASI